MKSIHFFSFKTASLIVAVSSVGISEPQVYGQAAATRWSAEYHRSKSNNLAAYTAPTVSSSVSTILDSGVKISDRLKAVGILGGDLKQQDITSLCEFLVSPPSARERNLPGLRMLKNNILNVLEQQSEMPAGLVHVMTEMYRNRAQDSVTRDYAVQHLALSCALVGSDDPEAREQIQTVLEEAVQESSSIAGTALLGLHRLFNPGNSVQSKAVDRYAQRMATSPETDPDSRITAVQVCAERKIMEALPGIEALVLDGEPTALRISAISALGRLGGPKQERLLRHLETGPHDVMHPAIEAALKQLEPTLASQGPLLITNP